MRRISAQAMCLFNLQFPMAGETLTVRCSDGR